MTQTLQAITFKGSVAIITEFLGFAIYSILYQRGVYPEEDFKRVTKYGVPLMISTDKDLNGYLAEILQQIATWIATDKVRKLVLTVANADDNMVVERWVFDIIVESINDKNSNKKSEEEIRREIQAVIRQITASVAYLPLLQKYCVFDLLVYTELDTELPSGTWEISDPRLIPNSSEVKLRSFSTSFHRLNASVTYREDGLS
ncbi:rev7 [Trypanosoma theileri]|uniref:Rev7 n=1 Tax=Trypanosoma theileri TaxID=67003 RepID=A0A1X0NYH2_9TRYP|nr:rev7 [Trypanosoma theileri]ORC89651.1 rev7 [Trypanosoma theileri]